MVAVYAPNIVAERASFFRWLAPFLYDPKRLFLTDDPKIDNIGRRVKRFGRCESSLLDLMAGHDLVDRFRLDHPGREIRTWLESLPE